MQLTSVVDINKLINKPIADLMKVGRTDSEMTVITKERSRRCKTR